MRTNGGCFKIETVATRFWVELCESLDGQLTGKRVVVDRENALDVAVALMSIMSPEEREILRRGVETRGGSDE